MCTLHHWPHTGEPATAMSSLGVASVCLKAISPRTLPRTLLDNTIHVILAASCMLRLLCTHDALKHHEGPFVLATYHPLFVYSYFSYCNIM